MSLPPGWEAGIDPSTGRTFYVNHTTQQTSWAPPIDSPLPAGWEERRDEHGRTFFYNVETQKTTWQDPRVQDASQSHTPVTFSSSPSLSNAASYPALSGSNVEPRYQLKTMSGSSTPSQTSSGWSCPSCTYENGKAVTVCDMCGATKPGSNVGGGGSSKNSRPVSTKPPAMSDEAMAAALQAELDREARQDEGKDYERDDSTTNIQGYQATEPFELLPNMVPDETSTKCLKCGKDFGKLVNRKHHCRCCGMLVCNDCSTKRTAVRLPTQEESISEKQQRVCDWCFDHLVDGHPNCLYRYVVVASKEQDENRELAIRGIADIMEQLPQQLSSSSDRQQALRDLEILKFVGGVAKMCSFLSPGDRSSTQAQACRLVAAVASASCIRELEAHLPKRQVASELSEGAALSIMATILERPPNVKENLSAQISAARVLYLLGDASTLKSAAKEANLIGPLCDALLSSDAQLQDWACMSLGRLLKGDRASVEEVLKHNGIHNLVLLLSSTNTLIQEHAALTLQEALVVDPANQGPKVKKALAGFSGTPAALRLLQSAEAQVVSAGLRLLLILTETEASQVRTLDGIPSLVSIVVGNGNNADSSVAADLQILALQVLRNVSNVGPVERHAISQSGGLSAAVTLMKSSTNSFVRKEATLLVESLSSDADGARGVMEASGGIAGLVDVVKTNTETHSYHSASNALSQIMMQGPEAQAAMLEAGALEALLAAGSRGDVPTACRVVETTFMFVSDPQLLPKLAANVPPSTLAQRLVHLGTSLKSSMPMHVTEQLVLTLAVLCGAKPDDFMMINQAVQQQPGEDETPTIIKVTSPQTRSLVAANGSAWLVGLLQNSLKSDPGVALACLRCLLSVSAEPANGDRVVQSQGLPVVLTAMQETLRAGDAPDTSSPQTQILLHSIALFARLVGGSRPRDAGRDVDSVRRGLRLLDEALGCHEPECMLTAVRAISECSFQSGTWATIAETSLPRCIEMLLADKTGHGPGGRDPLLPRDVLRLLMDVSTIASNLAKLEVHSNAILDSGGALALVALLSEPEDSAVISGINALSALADSSKRCAQMIAKQETGAIIQLLHLAETRKNSPHASRALKLVKRLAEADGQNAGEIGSTSAAVDTLLRLIRFEQSEDALNALCAVASASDALWERLTDTSDVHSTILLLERGKFNSARVQGRACRAIAQMCDQSPAMCVAEDVLETALPTMIKLIAPVDALGSDKSESPAVDAAWALASLCKSAVRDKVADSLAAVVLREDAVSVISCVQLLLRERRLGRPKSNSTAQALRAIRSISDLGGHLDAGWAWSQIATRESKEKSSIRKEDVFLATVMALDAHVTAPANIQLVNRDQVDAVLAIENACWFLSSFPDGLPADTTSRLSRPLSQAFEKSIQLNAFRVACLKAMGRAVREPALAATLVGSARAVAASLASERDEMAQVETGLLLGALLKQAPNDRVAQEAVASSGAVQVLYRLLVSATRSQTHGHLIKDTLEAVAMLSDFGGNVVRRSLRQSKAGDSESDPGLVQILRILIDSGDDDNWEDDSERFLCFRILSRAASLDEDRDAFISVRPCCLKAVEKRKCLRPAIELLGWLGTIDEEQQDEAAVDELLLNVVFDKQLPLPVRLQALTSCEFYVEGSYPGSTTKTMISFPKEIFYPTENSRLYYPTLLVLERLLRSNRVDIGPLVPSLLAMIKLDINAEDNQGLLELACSCLFEACRKSPKTRQQLRQTEGFLKVFKGMNLFGLFNAQRLLKVLGEEFNADKPVATSIKRTDSSSLGASNGGEKRGQDDLLKKTTSGAQQSPVIPPPPGGPPPPPPIKSAFPTFTATPSAQDRSSLDLAMRLQQLEMSNAPATATSYPRTMAPSMSPSMNPPPVFSSSSSSVWSCPMCTLENDAGNQECAACGKPRDGSSTAKNELIMCSGCGTKLQAPSNAPSVSCPKCRTVNTTQSNVRVRCGSCMLELYAPASASQFKCSNCGTVGNVRDRKVKG